MGHIRLRRVIRPIECEGGMFSRHAPLLCIVRTCCYACICSWDPEYDTYRSQCSVVYIHYGERRMVRAWCSVPLVYGSTCNVEVPAYVQPFFTSHSTSSLLLLRLKLKLKLNIQLQLQRCLSVSISTYVSPSLLRSCPSSLTLYAVS